MLQLGDLCLLHENALHAGMHPGHNDVDMNHPPDDVVNQCLDRCLTNHDGSGVAMRIFTRARVYAKPRRWHMCSLT